MLIVGVAPAHADVDTTPPAARDKGHGEFEGSHTIADGSATRPRQGKAAKSQPKRAQDSRRGFTAPPDPCQANPDDCTGSRIGATLSREAAESFARLLIVRLQLPTPTPQFGPDPSANEWNMAAVGYPLWLWTEGPTTVSATESAYGYTFTLRARYRSTTFDLGDGHTKQCTTTTVYRRSVKPGTASPTCGYTYLKAPRSGSYTVTATTHWDVAWSVAGFSGTLPGTHSASRQLRVGELQSVLVG